MNKSRATMSKETERTLKNMQDSDLKCLLDELSSYKQIGDMRGKSPLVQGLLKQAEESESGEESIKRPPKRHKKPKERRRRKESDSLAARTHAGGSLDNIGGEKAQTAARHRGVAGRTREGGSCCNLSRGSFETTVARRRRRRDPHRQHGGSLEDLSAIDETAAGAGRAKSSVSESGKHGGSLQNINQEGGGDFRPAAAAAAAVPAASPAAAAGASPSSATALAAAAVAAAPGPPPSVIDIDDEGPAAGAGAAASRASPRGGRSESTEPDRPLASGEVRADAAVDFSLRLDPRHQQPPPQQQQREPARQAPYTAPSGRLDLDSVNRSVGQLLSTRSAGYTRDEVHDMPSGELLTPSQRRAQSAAEGGGSGGVLIGQRPNSSNSLGSRGRKTKKKEEQEQKTEQVDGYRGEGDLEAILGFIESGDKKDKNGNKKSDKAKDGKKDTKNRKNGVRAGEEERSGGRAERSGGRGTERRPSGRAAAKSAPAGRSSSLEARPGPTAAAAGTAAAAASAAGHTDATSVFCGDLAKSSLKKSDSTPAGCRSKAGPSVVAFDGGTYVSPAAAERESEGFVQDFYSVTTDSTAIEETEFHVVTRKQRKRGGGARAGTAEVTRPHALRHKTSSLDEGGRARHESLGQPRRPYVPGLRQTTSSSAPHSELSDSDSDGAGSLPPPPPPSLVDQGGGRMVRTSPPPSAAPNPAPAPAAAIAGGGGGGGGGSSWADVTRNRQENHATTPTPIPATPTPTTVTPTPNPTAPASRAPQPVAGTRDAETSTDFIDGVGPIFGERSSPKGRPVAAVAAFVRGASEPADCLIGGSHPDEFPEIASTPAASAAAAAAKSPRSGPAAAAAAAAPAAATSSGGSAAPPVISPTTSVSSGAQTDARQTAGPAGPVPAPAPAPASPAVPASRAPAAAAAAAASPDTNSAMSGSASSPAARPASDANSTGDRRPAAPAPAPAPAARRTKKAPAVTIRGTLEDAVSPGASSAHVQGIQFGYIDPLDEPERSAGEPRPPNGAVEVFCRRFRSPSVDVTRFNWSEISIYLNKVYEEAARDPSAFFVANDTPNGLRRPVPAAAAMAAAVRPAL